MLDAVENPHPRMLAGALAARKVAAQHPACVAEFCPYVARWAGYLAAMVDATGCHPGELVAWLDRHES